MRIRKKETPAFVLDSWILLFTARDRLPNKDFLAAKLTDRVPRLTDRVGWAYMAGGQGLRIGRRKSYLSGA